jgi:hypothetical protein
MCVEYYLEGEGARGVGEVGRNMGFDGAVEPGEEEAVSGGLKAATAMVTSITTVREAMVADRM